MVLISVILPTYNWKKERISKAIESVLNQTFTDFELIIINDASTNDVEKTILQYKQKDNRILYLKNEKNLKLTNTLNRGIAHAKWKYIARIDDDDIWCDSTKLEKQIKFMEENPNYGICGTNVIVIDENGKVGETITMRETDRDIRRKILQSNQFAHTSIVIRKSALKEVGGQYDPEYNFAEDYELWCRIWVKTKLYNIQNSNIKYRINSNSISRKNSKKQKEIAFKVCKKNISYYPWKYKAYLLRFFDYFFPEKITQWVLKLIKRFQ